MDRVNCEICGNDFESINWMHLIKHNITLKEYKIRYPNAILKVKGKPSWNKGLTKETDSRVLKNSINQGLTLKKTYKEHPEILQNRKCPRKYQHSEKFYKKQAARQAAKIALKAQQKCEHKPYTFTENGLKRKREALKLKKIKIKKLKIKQLVAYSLPKIEDIKAAIENGTNIWESYKIPKTQYKSHKVQSLIG